METKAYQLILHFLTLFTVTVQFYVLYLIQKRSPKSMKEYRFFLNIFTAWDMLFTFMVGVILQPDSVPNLLAAWTRGLAVYFGPKGEVLAACLTVYAGSNVVMAQDYCLTYRFTVVHPNKRVHRIFMSKWYKAANLIGHQILSIFLASFMYCVMLKEEDIPSFIESQQENYSTNLSLLIKPGDFVLGINTNSKFTNLFMGTMLVSFIFSEILCVILIWLILSILKKNVAFFSRNTYKLHFQFTLLLIAQLLTPFIFIILPVAACLIAAFFNSYSPQIGGQLGFILITLYGMVNSLLAIVFIGPYRSHAKRHIFYPMIRPLRAIKCLKPFIPTAEQVKSISASVSDTPSTTVRRKTRTGSLYATAPLNRCT